MKRENLKKDYEIKEMRREEIENLLKENQKFELLNFEDENDYFMIRENKRYLYIIHEIEKKSQIHISRDRDIKIESRKIDNLYGIKIIYHRDSKGEKEFRIYLSYKDKDKKLIRKRIRNQKIDEISRDEKKMIEYYRNIQIKDFKDMIS